MSGLVASEDLWRSTACVDMLVFFGLCWDYSLSFGFLTYLMFSSVSHSSIAPFHSFT